ncbi:MAG: hypothetical protein V2B14_03865 [bacterium]
MENFNIIEKFFVNLRCSQCHTYFKSGSVKILRQDYNCTVIRIACSNCNKNIGLAILGLDKDSIKNNIQPSPSDNQSANQNEDFPFEINDQPINYDDVINAHNFFNNLGTDWVKYLPKNKDLK